MFLIPWRVFDGYGHTYPQTQDGHPAVCSLQLWFYFADLWTRGTTHRSDTPIPMWLVRKRKRQEFRTSPNFAWWQSREAARMPVFRFATVSLLPSQFKWETTCPLRHCAALRGTVPPRPSPQGLLNVYLLELWTSAGSVVNSAWAVPCLLHSLIQIFTAKEKK